MKVLLLMSLTIATVFAEADPEKGKKLFSSCVSCHGKTGMGKKSQKAPMIAGQYEWYIESQVKAIQAKERWNENAKKMFPFVKKLKDQDIKDLAAYISSMKLKK
jgi:cytochrome c553